MTQKSELGKLGEDLACEYLIKNGYKILERNFRKPWGELDIVAMARDKTLVFVEVKTMTESENLKPEDQMSKSKIEKFKRVAAFYAGENENLVKDKKGWRLDLLAITISGENNSIKHYENIE